jgi:hypothetical protein
MALEIQVLTWNKHKNVLDRYCDITRITSLSTLYLYVPSNNVSKFCKGAGVLSLNRVNSRLCIDLNCADR